MLPPHFTPEQLCSKKRSQKLNDHAKCRFQIQAFVFFFSNLCYCKYHFTSLHLKKTLCQSTFLQNDSYGNFKYGNLSIYLSTYLFRSSKFFNISFKNISFLFRNAHTLAMPINSLKVQSEILRLNLNT